MRMWVRWLRAGSPFLLGVCTALSPVCRADDVPSSAPAPGVNNGDWFRQNPGTPPAVNQPPAAGPSDTTTAPPDDWQRRADEGRQRLFAPFSYETDYPSNDIRDWVFANAHAATARAIFRRAENDLAAVYRRIQHNFEHSKAYLDAQAAERDAYAAYNAARHQALHDLYDDPKYKTLVRLRDDLADKLAQRRAAKDVTNEEILALATLKMEYASDARSMEVLAMSNDNSIADARQKLMAASQKRAQMQADYEESLRDNREIFAARENLEDARIALITAQAYLNGSATASAAALDYAYYLHRDQQARYDPYYGNGPSPYYSPYWVRY